MDERKHMRRILGLSLLLWAMMAAGQSYQDTLRVLCIGNSFTYVDSAHLKLRDLALSQGHYIDMNGQLQGGYTFHRHLRRDATLSAMVYYRFDHVFLQDQSQTPAIYAQSPRRNHYIADDARELADRIRMYSPKATIWLEQTWAYDQGNYGGFGSWQQFDELLRRGTKQMAHRAHARVSPIGEAFRICRAEHPEIDLYDADRKHQNAYGSYLKACVNYLLLYGEPFHGEPANCQLNSEACAVLRSLAERVVLHQ